MFYVNIFIVGILFINLIVLLSVRRKLIEIKEMKQQIIQVPQAPIIIEKIKEEPKEQLQAVKEEPKESKEQLQAVKELVKHNDPEEVIKIMLDELAKDGINSIEVDIETPISRDEFTRALKKLTEKLITTDEYERLKKGLETRYYFSYDTKEEMFEKYLHDKNLKDSSVNRYIMNASIKRYLGDFVEKTYFLKLEELEKRFEYEPKNEEDMFAMKEAYKNIVKKNVGTKLIDKMNV